MSSNEEKTRTREEEAERRAGLARARALWVGEHGSSRLRKALELGLLSRSLGVYRDERLAFELPGWRWAKDESLGERVGEILNPTEKALDLLAHWQKRFPDDAHLVSSLRKGEGGERRWAEAIAVDFPFADDDDVPDTALLFVEDVQP